MGTPDQDEFFGFDRRALLKASGMAAATCAMTGMGLLSNASAATQATVKEDIVETDVLVIGGGIAGTFAAIKAKGEGLDVTLVDKGRVGRSGKSPWLGAFTVFDAARGQSRDSYISRGMSSSDYIARRDYIELWLDKSKGIMDDIVSWGTVGQVNHGDAFRKQLKKESVRLLERVMITEFLVGKDGRVVGAVGFPMDEDRAIVIKAKAVVNCAGTGGFKNSGYPIGPLTRGEFRFKSRTLWARTSSRGGLILSRPRPLWSWVRRLGWPCTGTMGYSRKTVAVLPMWRGSSPPAMRCARRAWEGQASPRRAAPSRARWRAFPPPTTRRRLRSPILARSNSRK